MGLVGVKGDACESGVSGEKVKHEI
jgi:hypothetical protein